MHQQYEDTYLRDTTLPRVNRLIDAGKYIVVESTSGLPLPQVENRPEGTSIAYEFYGVYSIKDMQPPTPQSQLRAIHAVAQSGGRLIIFIDNQPVSLKTTWTQGMNPYGVIRSINDELSADPALACAVTRIEWDDETDYQVEQPMRLRNDHVSVACSSALWDDDNKQLVAVTLASSEQQSLRAIYATLVTNSKKVISLDANSGTVYLNSARRGYKVISGNLQGVGADGYVTSLLHPLTGNPQENTADWFYVVCRRGESQADLRARFVERLQLAIPWPVRPEWADYLCTNGPVKSLDQSGPDFFGCCVRKSAIDWETIIRDGLADGYLKVD